MQEVYAAMVLHSAGKSVDESGIKKIIESSGAKPDEAKIKALVSSLEGLDIDGILKEASSMTVAAAPSGESKEEKKEEEVDEKTAEKKAEEAAAGLSSLFG